LGATILCIVAPFSEIQARLIDQATAQKELKKLSEETDMFDSISDEDIAENKGKTFQDITALRYPLMGLGYGDAENPFDLATQDVATIDYSPNQPRDKDGKWTGGGLNSGCENSIIKLSNGKTITKKYDPDKYKNLEVGNKNNTQRK